MTYKIKRGEKLFNRNAAFNQEELDKLMAYKEREKISLRQAIRDMAVRGMGADQVDNRVDFTQQNNLMHS